MFKKRPYLFILIPLGIALFLAVGGWVVSWLWNALLPPLFGLPVIGFWQALGILALARILFGGVGHGSSYRSSARRHHGTLRDQFTAEERELIRQHLNMVQPEGEEAGS